MATITHQIQYWTYTIPPGQVLGLQYGPDDNYKTGTVQVMCCPSTYQAGTTVNYTQGIVIPAVENTNIPLVSGDIVTEAAYVSFNVTNVGQNTINYFTVAITVIGP
jgi:hypothetical protein